MNPMKKFTSLILALSLLLGVTMLTSCNLMSLIMEGADGFTEPNKPETPDDDDGETNIYVEGGDTNNITITPSDSNVAVAASKAILSVVSIYAEFERTYTSGWRTYTEPFAQSGSGVIYKLDKNSGDAYVITNYHVIHSSKDNSATKIARKLSLFLYGMESEDYAISAEFVGGSMQYDLAVLKITASPILISSLATAATIGDSNDVAVLDTAIAIGNPDASGISATVGYVNVDSEEISLLASDDKTLMNLRVMRIDAAINGGNSGGGAFNAEGELIGIVNAKKTSSDGMGYAIPSNVAKYIADNVIANCNGTTKTSVERCIVGITVTAGELYTSYDEESGRVHRCERVKVAELVKDSKAEDLFKIDDVIESITIDGKTYEVTRTFHVVDAMLNARVGSKVSFNIIRDGSKTTLDVTVTADMLVEYK